VVKKFPKANPPKKNFVLCSSCFVLCFPKYKTPGTKHGSQ